jgi:hypothetical protein
MKIYLMLLLDQRSYPQKNEDFNKIKDIAQELGFLNN